MSPRVQDLGAPRVSLEELHYLRCLEDPDGLGHSFVAYWPFQADAEPYSKALRERGLIRTRAHRRELPGNFLTEEITPGGRSVLYLVSVGSLMPGVEWAMTPTDLEAAYVALHGRIDALEHETFELNRAKAGIDDMRHLNGAIHKVRKEVGARIDLYAQALDTHLESGPNAHERRKRNRRELPWRCRCPLSASKDSPLCASTRWTIGARNIGEPPAPLVCVECGATNNRRGPDRRSPWSLPLETEVLS